MKRISFDDDMALTEAAICGRKTELRVLFRPQPVYSEQRGIVWKNRAFGLDLWRTYEGACANFIHDINHEKSHSIPFHKGDIVAVAQSYCTLYKSGLCVLDSVEELKKTVGWKNKGAVASSLMPYNAEILSMYLQKIQDITEEGCLSEGITKHQETQQKCVFRVPSGDNKYISTPNWKKAAELFFDKKFGKGTWKSNIWVLVYKFKILKNE